MIHNVKKLNINMKIHTEHVGSLCSSWSIHHSSALSDPRVCHGPPGIASRSVPTKKPRLMSETEIDVIVNAPHIGYPPAHIFVET
jgi:hypothetical protein